MPVTVSRLPRRLTIMGITITFALMIMWWILNAHDMNVPLPLWDFLEDATFVLCPPELPLGFSAMDLSPSWQFLAWCVAAALNGMMYYWLGRATVALRERLRR